MGDLPGPGIEPHCKVDSEPLDCQGSPQHTLFVKISVHLCLLHTSEKFTETLLWPKWKSSLSTPWFRGYGLINPIVCTDSFLQSSLNDVTAIQHPDFSSVAQSCLTLCDPMNRSTPGLPVHHQLPESTQTHVHCVGDAIQPSHPLSSPSPPAFNLSQHQGLFK